VNIHAASRNHSGLRNETSAVIGFHPASSQASDGQEPLPTTEVVQVRNPPTIHFLAGFLLD
jgi:hypothetical protein